MTLVKVVVAKNNKLLIRGKTPLASLPIISRMLKKIILSSQMKAIYAWQGMWCPPKRQHITVAMEMMWWTRYYLPGPGLKQLCVAKRIISVSYV